MSKDLAWDFYKWKISGPNLTVSVTPGMKILERGKRPAHGDMEMTRRSG
jgi:hypothetical protein